MRSLSKLSMTLGLVGLCATAAEAATELQSAVFRAKPAVVMIGVQVGATATVHCGAGAPVSVRPRPAGWLGSGSIIHSDGFVVTNGHVVQPFYEMDDAALTRELGEKAVAEGCAASLQGLSAEDRVRQVRALAAAPANRSGLNLEKALCWGCSARRCSAPSPHSGSAGSAWPGRGGRPSGA